MNSMERCWVVPKLTLEEASILVDEISEKIINERKNMIELNAEAWSIFEDESDE